MIKETGKWKAIANDDGSVVIQSNDFTHDVMLIVDGGFRDVEQRLEYAEEMAKRLNLYKEPEKH